MTHPFLLNRRGFLSAVGGMTLMPRIAGAAAALGPIKEEDAVIAFAHVSPTADEGWTFSHHQGALAVKARFPKVKILEVENVPLSADATRTFRRFVAQHANMVFTTTEYADLLSVVASAAPSTAFMECGGHHLTPNVSGYYVAEWLPSFVLGVAAGLLTKTNKLGYIASFPVPFAYANVNAFQMGARSVNPKAITQVVSINSWFDPQAATQAATALVDNGADFLFGIMDEASYLQVAEKRKVWAAMWNTDVRRYGPNAYVSSLILDWREFYLDQVSQRLNGTWQGGQTHLLSIGKGIDRDAWGQNVPESVRTQADAVREKLINGQLQPFVGEIRDNKGAVRVAAGKAMTDMDLYLWDYPVEGVMGF
jgi:basic membrane protein A